MIELDRQSPSAAHWSRQQYETLFATGDADLPRHLVWVADGADAGTQEIVGEPRRLLAMLVARAVDSEWEVENIVVEETYRRRGVGTHLVCEFIEHASGANASAVFLEVRQSNQPARALYCKLGFVETGSRTAYYATPREDAILYRLDFH